MYCWSGGCLSSAVRFIMLTGVEGGLYLRGVGLHGRFFRALRARVISSTTWFVAYVSIY